MNEIKPKWLRKIHATGIHGGPAVGCPECAHLLRLSAVDRAQPVLFFCFNGDGCRNTVLHPGESCPWHAPTAAVRHPGWVDPVAERAWIEEVLGQE